jgi:hypothetical protein
MPPVQTLGDGLKPRPQGIGGRGVLGVKHGVLFKDTANG